MLSTVLPRQNNFQTTFHIKHIHLSQLIKLYELLAPNHKTGHTKNNQHFLGRRIQVTGAEQNQTTSYYTSPQNISNRLQCNLTSAIDWLHKREPSQPERGVMQETRFRKITSCRGSYPDQVPGIHTPGTFQVLVLSQRSSSPATHIHQVLSTICGTYNKYRKYSIGLKICAFICLMLKAADVSPPLEGIEHSKC